MRDSSVGRATGYGLDGPRIESRWRLDLIQLFRPAVGPTHHWVSSPGVKRPGRSVNPPPLSAAQIRAVPLLPLWAFMACSGANCTFSTVAEAVKVLPTL